MYAIVKTGGKQYRVESGQRLLIERVAAEEGADVALEPVFYRSEEAIFEPQALKSVKVTARVLGHVRGPSCGCSSSSPSAATSGAPATGRN